MRAKPFQILWHQKLPIFSVDFERFQGENVTEQRLATAGGDNVVRLWRICQGLTSLDETSSTADQRLKKDISPSDCHKTQNNNTKVDFLASLTKHTGVVNVVRWSPIEPLLASAGDDGMIFIWKQSLSDSNQNQKSVFRADAEEEQFESWVLFAALSAINCPDIYDIAWSPKGDYICAGTSIDNSVRIFSLASRRTIQILQNHSHFVQGVAWDPRNVYIVSQSSDRSVVTYMKSGKNHEWQYLSRSSKVISSKHQDINTGNGSSDCVQSKSHRLYHDETLVSFFRRLSFSPDGSIMVAPAGLILSNTDDRSPDLQNSFVIYSRSNKFREPLAYVGGLNRPAVVVKFNHIFFELRNDHSDAAFINLPYRMIFAVGTQDAVLFYDTQQLRPFASISNLHYSSITDITWASDGQALIVSSTDGFCSIIKFAEKELGQRVKLNLVNTDTENHPLPSISANDFTDSANDEIPNRMSGGPKKADTSKRRIIPTLI